MKFGLTQASCCGAISLSIETFDKLVKEGFDVNGTKTKSDFRYFEAYDDASITFNTFEDFIRFINKVGPIVVDNEDSITIYDDYIE